MSLPPGQLPYIPRLPDNTPFQEVIDHWWKCMDSDGEFRKRAMADTEDWQRRWTPDSRKIGFEDMVNMICGTGPYQENRKEEI